ncbi:MAG: hypothetical protein JSS60_04775 [Verrucomicrobia bacterium]|nr:hypothetical protein [Verrucomicrobiota bacterium]
MSLKATASHSDSSATSSTVLPIAREQKSRKTRRSYSVGLNLGKVPQLLGSTSDRPHLSSSHSVTGKAKDAESKYQVLPDEVSVVTVRVPLDRFVDCIDIPVVSYSRWKEKVNAALVRGVVKTDLSNERVTFFIDDVYNRCLKYSSILKRVQKACELLSGVSEYSFLSDFAGETSPVGFWKKFEKLKMESTSGSDLLYRVIGKEGAWIIVRKAAESDGATVKKRFQSHIDTILPLEKKRRTFQNLTIEYPTGFDIAQMNLVTVPVFAQNYKEFAESFRAFYSDGPFPQDSIRFNNECLTIPDIQGLQLDESQREFRFIGWLISQFEKKMELGPTPPAESQRQLFAMEQDPESKFLKKKLPGLLAKSLRKIFEDPGRTEDISAKIGLVLNEIPDEEIDFPAQMRPFTNYIGAHLINCEAFKQQNWKEVSQELIRIYSRLYLLEGKHSSIPSLSLLKAMCFGSYGLCALSLLDVGRKKARFEDESACHLALNHDVIGSYNIEYDNGQFKVVHRKSYHILREKTVRGELAIEWTVSGKLKSYEYAACLKAPEVHFSPDCSAEESKLILEQLFTDFFSICKAGGSNTSCKIAS